ncbi:MAG: hypothetical protein ACR2OZ_20560 [Verrucomicrobiales bacterium]
MMETTTATETARHVAVLVVHGVADQKQGESARAGAALLELSSEADYTTFEESRLHVPVRKVESQSMGGDVEDEFMRQRLANYEPADDDSCYDTVRLSARRRDLRTQERREVHVYEMFWADLSRLGSGVQRWLVELYDLTFLMCIVGGIAVTTAAQRDGNPRSWKVFGALHETCKYLLTRILPMFAMAVLWMGTPLLVARVPSDWHAWAIAGMGAAFALGIIGYASRRHLGSYRWLLAIAAVGAVILFGLHRLADACTWANERLLLLAALVAAAAGLALAYGLWRWGRGREGPLWPHLTMAGAIMAAAVACLAWEWLSPGAHQHNLDWLIDRTIRAAEWLILPTELAWVTLFVVFVGMVAVAWLWVPLEKSHSPARRAARWTATISVFLPAIALMMINISLGWAVAVALPRIVGPAQELQTKAGEQGTTITNALDRARHLSVTPPWWGRHFLLNGSKLHDWSEEAAGQRNQGGDPTKPASETIRALVENSSSYLPGGLLLLGGGFILALWGLLPALLAETRVGSRALAALASNLRRETSIRQGRDMDTVFRILRYTGNVMCLAVCLVVLLMMASLVPSWNDPVTDFLTSEKRFGPVLARLLGLVMLALLLSHGWFRVMALGFRNALDVGLDALNWLRPSPRQATPRARIVTRLSAMLHHLQRWKNPVTGRGYDAVVILAHSQGSMIAIETLRFWKRRAASRQPGGAERSQPLSRYFSHGDDSLPISLFTMGNPLRQLYLQRFPHLYYWAGTPVTHARVSTGDAPEKNQPNNAGEADPAGETPIPNLDDAGLCRWWNAYRSGDYVGRDMWGTKDTLSATSEHQGRFEPAEHPPAPTARVADFCIGAGAHLRYWDETAPLISQSLDRLVATA